MSGQERCHHCKGWIRDGRITLPRAKTGDLVFCRFICIERWRAKGSPR